MADIAANCTSCGMPIDPGSAYCGHCGARAPEHPTSAPAPASAAPPPRSPAAAHQSLPPAFGAGQGGGSPAGRGFLRSLFDLSFTSLITVKLVKVIYVLWMIVIGLGALGSIAVAFRASHTLGFLVLFIIAPIISLFYLVMARVFLEIFVVLFRIQENTGELVTQGRRDA